MRSRQVASKRAPGIHRAGVLVVASLALASVPGGYGLAWSQQPSLAAEALTAADAPSRAPAWHPRDNRIAFERQVDGRWAVGAKRPMLLQLVAFDGLRTCGAGLLLGALLTWAMSGVLTSLLYEVSATDPAVFVGASAGLSVVAAAGYLWPALRASRVEPVAALRAE